MTRFLRQLRRMFLPLLAVLAVIGCASTSKVVEAAKKIPAAQRIEAEMFTLSSLCHECALDAKCPADAKALCEHYMSRDAGGESDAGAAK